MSSFHTYELAPVTCLDCRRTFKRMREPLGTQSVCIHCNGRAFVMDRRFRPPKKLDASKWEVVSFLVQHGFFFQSIYITKPTEKPNFEHRHYPSNMAQARDFVKQYASQSVPSKPIEDETRR